MEGLTLEICLRFPSHQYINAFRLQQDDVIFNNTNSLELIGKTSIVNKALPYTFSNHLTRIRVDKSKILPYWLYLLFLRYRKRSVFKSICNTHVGQSGIGKIELQNLQIFFPPMTEQKKIALILSKVDESIEKSNQIIDQTQRLKKGLMQNLLTKGIKHSNYNHTDIGKIACWVESFTHWKGIQNRYRWNAKSKQSLILQR